MREGAISDPEQREELEGSLRQTLGRYETIHNVARAAMIEAAQAGNQEEADRQARRAEDWLRQMQATQATLDTLQRTGIYQINLPADAKLNAEK